MPAVQKQFETFHSNIKLDDDNEKAKLREKRETLVKTLKANLGTDVPSFEHFNQGSYSMHSGVVPLDGNYDIDVGLIFDCKRDRYSDPVELKKKVRDALDTNGRTVTVRRCCVTADYMREGTPEYHVDLAIYAKRGDGLLDLAKGKDNSDKTLRLWETSDPKTLTEIICSAFSDADDLAQYRRCIRYLKRWRDVQFRNGGAPLSIALTVAAKTWFKPRFETSGKPTDLLALLDWVKAMLANFQDAQSDDGWHKRLKVVLPVAPYADLTVNMAMKQMTLFRDKLETLRDALSQAYDEDLPEDACKRLNQLFGADFEVPQKAQTARKVSPPVISTGNSA